MAKSTRPLRKRQVPLAPIIGAMFGAAAAILVVATPLALLERGVVASGIADLVAFAQPPLGMKARAVLVMLAFMLAGGATALLVLLAERVTGAKRTRRPQLDDELDLHPYADPVVAPPMTGRKPIFADRELGAPFMSDEVIARAPINYSEREPDAAPELEPEPEREAEPAPETQPASQLIVSPIAPDVLDLPPVVEKLVLDTPPVAEGPDLLDTPVPAPLSDDTSLDTLIRRLEAGMARRTDPRPPTPAAAPPVAVRDWPPRAASDSSEDAAPRGALRWSAR